MLTAPNSMRSAIPLKPRNNMNGFKDYRTENGSDTGQNLALTGSFVPISLFSGFPSCSRNRAIQSSMRCMSDSTPLSLGLDLDLSLSLAPSLSLSLFRSLSLSISRPLSRSLSLALALSLAPSLSRSLSLLLSLALCGLQAPFRAKREHLAGIKTFCLKAKALAVFYVPYSFESDWGTFQTCSHNRATPNLTRSASPLNPRNNLNGNWGPD